METLPLTTSMATVLSPSAHSGAVPLAVSVPLTVMLITALSLSAVALILLLALLVVAVYAVTVLSKDGDSVSEPIVSPVRFAVKGLP